MPKQNIEQLIVQLSADIKRYENALRKANGQTNKTARHIENRFNKMNRNISSGARRLGRILAGGFVGRAALIGARELLDSATRIDNALKIAGLSGKQLTDVYGKLFESAIKNGAPFETLVDLYGKAALAQKELKVTSAELLRFTDNVAISLRVAGKSASESRGALIQLSQAIGGGIVRAEEFNAILEGALPIAQATARGLKEAGGSVAKLRKLIIDGKVSSEAFFRAFEAGAPILEDKVKNAELTIAQSMENVRTALTGATTKFDDATSASRNFAKAINSIGDVINQFDIAPILDKIDELNNALGNFGNNPIFRRLNELIGTDVGEGQFFPGEGVIDRDDLSAGKVRQFAVNQKTGRLPSASVGDITEVSLDDFALPEDDKKAAKRLKRFEREIELIKDRTAAIHAETDAQSGLNPLVEDYGYTVEKAAAVHELMTAAHRAGIAVTPELRAKIDELAEGYANAVVEAERLAEAQDNMRESAEEMRDLGQDSLGGFISDLRRGVTETDALANALGKVADKLFEISLDSLFSGFGGGGFSFPKLFGFAKGGIAAHGRPQPLPTFAKGGVSSSASIFGEAGPEAAVPLPDGKRIPVDLRMPDIRGMRGGGEHIRISLQADPGVIAEIADQRIETKTGNIINVSVEQARQAATADFAANSEEARLRGWDT